MNSNITTPAYKNSICHLRWGYPNISLTRNEIRTCCKTPFQSVTEKEIEFYGTDLFLNNKYQLSRRLEMLKGLRHKDCNQCWQLEDKGASSLRGNSEEGFVNFAQHNNLFDEFETNNLNYISDKVNINSKILRSNRPFMLEVSLGNTCDLKCMYCNHVYSSQWATESLKNSRITKEIYDEVTSKPNQKFIDLFWEWMNKETKFSLQRIGIIGGEPLITPDLYPFLDKLLETYEDVDHRETTIWIVTNLNSPDNYYNKFLNYIPKLDKKFKLEILISMESINEQAEYIRNGLNWSKFEKNVYKLFAETKDNDRITLGFLPSVSALSIPRFKQFLQWVYKIYETTGKPAMLKQNTVTSPSVHSPFVLTPDYADYVTDALDWIKTIAADMPNFNDVFGRWQSYIIFLENLRDSLKSNKDNIELRKKFYHWFNDFDQLRNLNFNATFPELNKFFNYCKELNDNR